jgi:hypothetical protein
MPGRAQIGNLSVSLTMNTAAFQKGATLAEKRAKSLQTNMAGIGSSISKIGGALALGAVAGGVAVLGGMAKSAFELGSSLTEAAAKVGVTVEALQEMRFAATQNGISIETMDGSLNKMTKTLGELSLGNKTVAANFKELGLSARDFVGLTPTESFAKIADALKGIESETERAALGNKLFGRSYAELKPLVDLGAAGINAAAAEKRKDGVISTEQAAKLDDLADGWDKLKDRVMVASAQFIANRAGSASASEGMRLLSQNITNLIGRFESLLKIIDKANLARAQFNKNAAIGLAINPVTGNLPGMKEYAQGVINDSNQVIQRATSNGGGKAGTRGGRGSGLLKSLQPGGAGGALAGSMAGAGAGAIETLNKLEAKAANIGKTVGEPMTRTATTISTAFQDLSDQAQPVLDRLFPEVKAQLDYKADQNTLAAWAKAGKIDADKLTESLKRLRDMYYGVDGPMAVTQDGGFVENITDSLPDLADVTNQMAGRIKQSTDSIAESFADSAQRVVGSIGFMTQSIKSGGFLGILEGVLNLGLTLGSVGAFGSNFAAKINGARARGGNVNSNGRYLVGERGPEIFTPNRTGYITPNNKMNEGGRVTTVSIVPTPYFDAVVDGRAARQVTKGAPGIASAAAQGIKTNLQQNDFRRLP